jgi:hypothetical protein
MQNMSMKKLLLMFGGFMLAIVLVTAVIASQTMKKSTAPHAVQRHAQAEFAQDARASSPVSIDPSFGTINPTPPMAVAPASTPRLAAIEPAQAASAPPANEQHFRQLDGEISDHESRITALEAQRAAPVKTARAGAGQRPRSHEGHLLSVDATQELLRQARPTKVATDYHTLAVVGERAWVSAQDGTTESVVVGDELPRVRIKAVQAASGAVITSSDITVPSGH